MRTTPSALALISLVVAACAGFITFLFVPQRFAPLAAAVGGLTPFFYLMNRRGAG